MSCVVFRKPGPTMIEDPQVPRFFVETIVMVTRMPGGNACFTYCIERRSRSNRPLWVPQVELVRPIALMPVTLRRQYAEVLEGPCPGHGEAAQKRHAIN